MSKKLSFSQRIGKTPVRTSLQYEEIDKPLDNALWNWLDLLIDKVYHAELEIEYYAFAEKIWTDFFNLRLKDLQEEMNHNNLGFEHSDSLDALRIEIRNLWDGTNIKWYRKYDLINFILDLISEVYNNHAFGLLKPNAFDLLVEDCNSILKKHLAGYTIISNELVPITSEIEVQSIEESLNTSWSSINKHIKQSLQLLSNRNNPDYRNSVKESISAVEAVCKIALDDKNIALGRALKKMQKNTVVWDNHYLFSAIEKLYIYSNNSGSRHSIPEDEVKVSLEEAKFVLITCSAFVNYVKTRLSSTANL